MPPRIIAHHIIFTTYGFWLPNDPRGSWSDFVREWEIFQHGYATKTTERRSLAHDPHDRQKRLNAKQSLRYEPVKFTGQQALAVVHGFARAVDESKYDVFACSVMKNHVHCVIGKHNNPAERMIGHFKSRATQQLKAEGLHPFGHVNHDNPPCVWARRGWKVFLNSDNEVMRAIRYVEGNPLKDGLKTQNWSFVVPFH